MRNLLTILSLLLTANIHCQKIIEINGTSKPATIRLDEPRSVNINRDNYKSYPLDGIDDSITVPQTTLNFNYTDSQSYEIWFKPDTLRDEEKTLLSMFNTSTNKGTKIFVDDDRYIHFYARNGSEILDVSDQYNDGAGVWQILVQKRWYHLVVTYNGTDASGVKIYVDGRELFTTTVSNTLASDPENEPNVVFGKNGSVFSNISIGVTRIFGKVLSAAEVSTLYNNGTPLLKTSISDGLFEILLAKDRYIAGAYKVNESVSGSFGTTNVSFMTLTEMDINLIQKRGNQYFTSNTLVYETFRLSGEQSLGSDAADSPLADKRTNIIFDSAENRTYIAWSQRPYLGGNRQSMVMYVDHANQFATPSYSAGYFTPGTYNNHQQPAIIVTPDNEILLAVENKHDSPIYIKKTKNKDITTWYETAVLPLLNAYPALTKFGNDTYVITRGGGSTQGWMRDYIAKSGNGGITWAGRKWLLNNNNGTGTDRAYFDVIWHPTKYILLLRNREESVGLYLAIYYIESEDGHTWRNIDGTFEKDIDTTEISRLELDTYCTVRVSPTDDSYIKNMEILSDGTPVAWGNSDPNSYIYMWWDGDSWESKPLPLPNFIPVSSIGNEGRGDAWFAHCYDANHHILWRLEERGGFDVVVQYETFDAWDTWDAGTIISNPDKNHEHLCATFNRRNAGKVILGATQWGDGSTGSTNMWIYEFTP